MSLAHDCTSFAGSFDLATFQRPFRPVQYLGNKLRALDQIVDAASSVVGKEARTADLFTGTSVVAQAFASLGHEVTAVDTQRYSVVFSHALLNIGRRQDEQLFHEVFCSKEASYTNDWKPWVSLAELEEAALGRDDYDALKRLYDGLPLIWRQPNNPHYHEVYGGSENTALFKTPLFTTIYSGHYFGVKQALAIDGLRHQLELLYTSGDLSEWQYNTGLTALMYAASAAVHSAGKHFAQPLGAGSSTNHNFLRKRLLEDRKICVLSKFRAACDELNARNISNSLKHTSLKSPAENFVETVIQPYDLYYLDPPYTAQQYSRFYHVLETLVSYRFPQLVANGRVTTGIYPLNRYKSAFSSKGKAHAAFQKIIVAAKRSGTSLLVSYSASARSSDGNARMITLNGLLEECREVYGASKVHCDRMEHRYRQFNSSDLANDGRDDPEVLITCSIR